MTDIVKRPAGSPSPITDDEVETTYRLAKSLWQSGLFKDIRSAEEAYAKVIIGRDLGMSPAVAMTGIHIVEGKPQLHYATMAAFVRRHEHYDYRVREHTDESCTVAILMDGEEIGTASFSMEDRARAGIGNQANSNWKKYPRTMLFARALSTAVRWHAPDALMGMPTYVEGEIEPEPQMVNGARGGEVPTGDLADDPLAKDDPPEADVVPEPIPGQMTVGEALNEAGAGEEVAIDLGDDEEPPPDAGLPFDEDER